MRSLIRDTTPSTLLAGLVAIVIGWSGPNVLIYSVQQAGHLSQQAATSWLWAHAVCTGLAGLYLSFRTRLPLLSTWSTPGIAFLATALSGFPFSDAVGAFWISAVLVFTIGCTPLVGVLERLPLPLTAALNAAILLPFALRAVAALGAEPGIVGAMVVAYLVVRLVAATWAVASVLVVGIVASLTTGALHPVAVTFELTRPELVAPTLSPQAIVSLALPLTLLAFTGQFLPGVGVLRAHGYAPDAGRIVRACGVASVPAALFGCHSITVAALLANVVAGPDADPRPERRWTAAAWASAFGITVGLFAGTVLQAMGALPAPVITALAGLALLGPLTQSLTTAFGDQGGRASHLAPVAIFAVTLSGLAPWGIGSACWGVLAGLAVYGLERSGPLRRAVVRRPPAPASRRISRATVGRVRDRQPVHIPPAGRD